MKHRVGCNRLHRLESGRIAPRYKNVRCVLEKALSNSRSLLGRLSMPKDNLGETLAQSAMMINARVSEILEREVPELPQRLIETDVSIPVAREELLQSFLIHLQPIVIPRVIARVRHLDKPFARPL